MWLRINRGCVKTEEDAQALHKLQVRHKANFDTHTERSMWFNFKSNNNCINFARNVLKQLPYLNVTIGT